MKAYEEWVAAFMFSVHCQDCLSSTKNKAARNAGRTWIKLNISLCNVQQCF